VGEAGAAVPECRCVALLRGVNVGGRNKVSMAELAAEVGALGHRDVTTYIQSGNVVLSCDRADVATLAESLAQMISSSFGAEIAVVVRTHDDLASVVAANPFPEAAAVPASLHVAFLSARPSSEATTGVDPMWSPPDRFAVVGSEVYLHYPNGSGRSKLTADFLERRLGVRATARNWNTVLKLEEMSR